MDVLKPPSQLFRVVSAKDLGATSRCYGPRRVFPHTPNLGCFSSIIVKLEYSDFRLVREYDRFPRSSPLRRRRTPVEANSPAGNSTAQRLGQGASIRARVPTTAGASHGGTI